MPQITQVNNILDKVRSALKEAESEGIFLSVEGERLDDDWLYIVVAPSKPGVRASDHASLMSRIERSLRSQGDENVLLVPALED